MELMKSMKRAILRNCSKKWRASIGTMLENRYFHPFFWSVAGELT